MATRRNDGRAFTIVEVMIAASVMVLAISSSLIVLQHGLRAIDTARYTTLAGQVLQSQMEKLRLLTWTQINSATGPVAYTTFTPDVVATATAQLQRFTVAGVPQRCAQAITDASELPGGFMKKITLTATWSGSDGRPHTLSYITYYAKNGMSDFFYTTH